MGIGAGTASLALQGGGSLMSAGGAYAQAQTQQNVLNYESQVAGNNAIFAGYQADVAKQVGAQQVEASQMKSAATFGTDRATLAANGVELGSGSATDVLASTKYMGMRDAMTIQDNTNRQAWAYGVEKSNYLSEAGADKAMASSISPGLAAFGSLLGSAGSVGKSWYQMSKAGSV